MPFKPGVDPNRAKGGKREGAGRPTKDDAHIQLAARVIARSYIERHVEPLMATYLGLAAGKVVERTTAEGTKKFELLVDPPTTRHAVDKLLPDEQEVPQSGDTYIQFNFGLPAGSAPSVGLHNGNGRNLNGGTLHIGGDGSESE